MVKKPLYLTIIEILGCPVGTIPYYVCFDKTHGIDKSKLLSELKNQAESGISFWTLHFTANLNTTKSIYNRNTPVISRGGGLLLRDMQINNRKKNILFECIDEIINLCLKHDICISVGTTYRASNIIEGFDEIQKAELLDQKRIIEYLISNGVHVIQEGVGHLRAEYIAEYTTLLRKERYIPFMPLGPIISDRTQGKDHINNAIGAYIISSHNGADIINTVTREEHTGGIPSMESIKEAIETAKTVATIIDDQRFYDFFNGTNGIYMNCMNKNDIVGCDRCGDECPFLWDYSK